MKSKSIAKAPLKWSVGMKDLRVAYTVLWLVFIQVMEDHTVDNNVVLEYFRQMNIMG